MGEKREVEKENLSEIFERYLQDKASAEDINTLLAYFDLEEHSPILRQLIRDVYHEQQTTLHTDETRELLARTKQTLLQRIAAGKNTQVVPMYRQWWFRISTAALIIFSVGFWFRSNIYDRINPVHLVSIKTSRGERKIIDLADGTKVWLSPASSLEYPDQFRKSTRDIKLTGEAFFDVTKDQKHPFIVHAGTLDTKVLGTTFNIRAYSEDKKITVVLLTGKVAITSARHAQTNLIPNQIAEYNPATNKLQKTDYPQALQMLDRRNGFYHYEGTPVLAIIADLKRDYNINIETEGDLGNCTFYGDFKNGDDPLVFLRKVCIIINAQFKRNENGIKIIGRGC